MGSIFTLKPYQPKARYIPKVVKHEENLQRAVCSYIRNHYPHVIFRSDYSSGLHLTVNQARINKSLQSGRSFPDLFLYEPRGGYAGLAIELKKDKTAIIVTTGPRKGHLVANPHIQEQYLMLKDLKRRGYKAEFGIGYDATIRIIDEYMGVMENTTMF